MSQKKFSVKSIALVALLAAFGASSASADVVNLVQNGSFEEYTGNMQGHGYLYKDGTSHATLPGWTYTPNTTKTNYGFGIGKTDGEFVKNVGPIDGTYALFMQRPGTMTQTITGLTPGELYTYSFNYDARHNNKAKILAKVGNMTVLNREYNPRNPFYTYEVTFRATEETMDISFANTYNQDQDTSVLVDKVQMTAAAADNPWTCSGTSDLWISDAAMGIDSSKIYTHTMNFGGAVADTAMVSGVLFKGIKGAGTTDYYSIPQTSVYGADNGLKNVFTESNPGSQAMANGFFLGMSEITLDNLMPGMEYTTTFYLASWDGTTRAGFITAPDGTTFGLDENKLRTENGGRAGGLVSWTGKASEDGTLKFNILSPDSGNTLHVYGVSNSVVAGQTPESVGTNLLFATKFGGPNGDSYEGMQSVNTAADVVNFLSPAGSEKWTLSGAREDITPYVVVQEGALRTGANCANMMEIDSTRLAGKWINLSVDLKLNTLQGNEKPNARGLGIGFRNEDKQNHHGESGIGFSGLVLSPAGELMFYENANGSSINDAVISDAIAYVPEDGGAAFSKNDWYTLDMVIDVAADGETATLLGVSLKGSDADYSALTGKTFGTLDLLTILSSSSVSWNYYGLVDNLQVSEYVPEPSTWALLVLGAGSLLVLRRRKR